MNSPVRLVGAVFLIILASFLVGCSSSSQPAEVIAATSGSGQSAQVGAAFTNPFVVTVMKGSTPISGATVTFAAPASGASGTFAGGVTTATTNSSGMATSPAFTANTRAGAYVVSASVSGVSTAAAFNLTNTPGPPSSIAATSGTPQSAAAGSAFTASLVATVLDSDSNPVSGVTVTFTAPSSGAGGTFANGTSNGTVYTATTNASGLATASTLTANSTIGGPYTVTAAASGVLTAANFSLTNTLPPPVITVTSGSGQNAQVGAAFAAPLVATVTQNGSPLSGVTVTFAAPSSGASGTFAGGINTATTNASGIATSVVFTANTTAGSYLVPASTPGATALANFSLTNTPGPAASIAATSGSAQGAQVNQAFTNPLVATVLDNHSNPVSGVTVTFTAPSSGASGTFASGTSNGIVYTTTTDASGVATSSIFTANATVGGPYNITAAAAGVGTSASFSLTNTVASACTGTLNNGLLNGHYAFTLKGWSSSTTATSFAGSFIADGQGNLRSGLIDIADQMTNPGTLSTTFTGTYCVGSNNLAVLTITPASGRTATLAAALDNNDQNGHIIGYDTSGKLISGALLQQSASAFSSGVSGNYAFGLTGADQAGKPYSIAGQFVSNSGTLSGQADYSDSGNATAANISLNSTTNLTVDTNTGRGTATIFFSSGISIDYVFYIVNTSQLIMMALDSTENPPVTMTGRVFSQASNLTLSGTAVLSWTDIGNSGQSEVEGGILTVTAPGGTSGTFSAILDNNNGGNLVGGGTTTGTYNIAPGGRMPISNLSGCPGGCGNPPVFYVYGTNQAFMVGTGGDAQFGSLLAQTKTAFGDNDLAATYLGGTQGTVLEGAVSVSTVKFNSTNGMESGTDYKNSLNGTVTSPTTDTLSADYCPATSGTTCGGSSSNGRFLITCPMGSTSCTPGSLQKILYMVSDSQWIAIDADSGDTNPKTEEFHQ